MTDILRLRDIVAVSVDEDAHHYHIAAVPRHEPTKCPQCGCEQLRKHDSKTPVYRDLPIHGKQVAIYLTRKRFRCTSCPKVFMRPLSDLPEGKRYMTQRLLDWVRKESLKRPFAHVAEEVGLAESAVRHVFQEYAEELGRTVRFEAPHILGIDEIHIIRKPRCVIGNVGENTIVDILPTRTKDAVTRYLSQLKGRENVRLATLDMWRPYRDAIELVMPQTDIVVDKFHVLALANKAMDSARKRQRATLTPKESRTLKGDRFTLLKRPRDLSDREQLILSGWRNNFPVLDAAYAAKEAFFDMYQAETQAEAERLYEAWRNSIPESVAEDFSDLVRAVDNWHPYVMAYFTHRVTNAFSESINNLIRLMNRLGRGYSFDALRAKVLYTDQLHKTKRPRLRPRRQQPIAAWTMTTELSRDIPAFVEEEKTLNFGVDIQTLIRLLETESF